MARNNPDASEVSFAASADAAQRAAAVCAALGHPLRLRILDSIASSDLYRRSSKELADELNEPLGNTAYHVRALAAAKLLRPAGTAPARGAIEHFYRLSDDTPRILALARQLPRAT